MIDIHTLPRHHLYSPHLSITTRTEIRKKFGVYVIWFTEENVTEPVYIGMSKSCLYKALYRHFEHWDDHRRVTYSKNLTFLVSYIVTETKGEAENLEKELIIKYNPRDNSIKYRKYQSVVERVKDSPF